MCCGGRPPPKRAGRGKCIIPRVPLILASASPRRAALLGDAGFAPVVRPASVDERPHPGEPPAAHVGRIATAKALAVTAPGDAWVVAADTIVVVDRSILGKPRDPEEAAGMLERLSGREHDVYTGVAVRRGGSVNVAVAVTRVWFRRLDAATIRWYVESGEPMDKAGAYAIQGRGARFVERIEGSCSNVVGLPVAVVDELLRATGWVDPAR